MSIDEASSNITLIPREHHGRQFFFQERIGGRQCQTTHAVIGGVEYRDALLHLIDPSFPLGLTLRIFANHHPYDIYFKDPEVVEGIFRAYGCDANRGARSLVGESIFIEYQNTGELLSLELPV